MFLLKRVKTTLNKIEWWKIPSYKQSLSLVFDIARGFQFSFLILFFHAVEKIFHLFVREFSFLQHQLAHAYFLCRSFCYSLLSPLGYSFDYSFSRSQTPFGNAFHDAPRRTFFSGSDATALIVIRKYLSNWNIKRLCRMVSAYPPNDERTIFTVKLSTTNIVPSV